jgi:hypothetical protein
VLPCWVAYFDSALDLGEYGGTECCFVRLNLGGVWMDSELLRLSLAGNSRAGQNLGYVV